MADGSSIGYFPGMSRLMGEVDSPTNTAPMTQPQFGGSPEQMMAFLQSPHVQDTLAQWGIHFNPSQVRQSPFVPNSLMNAHPMLGRGLSGAMAGATATPEAPLVSGAGSGISRAMQGIMGGNEMQRQYQVRQLMAPMQGIGMQMPEAEFQRKQQLLEALKQDLDARESQAQAALAQKQQHDLQTQQLGIQRTEATKPFTDAAGHVWNYTNPQAAQPAGGPEGTNFQMEQHGPGARTVIDPNTGQPTQMPGWTLSGAQPAIPGGWGMAPQQPSAADINAIHPDRVGTGALRTEQAGEVGDERQAGMGAAKVADVKAQGGLRTAQAGTEGAKQGELGARAERERAEAQQPGGHYGQARNDRLAKEYNDTEKYVLQQKQDVARRLAAKQLTPEEAANETAQWDNHLATAKENYDRAMSKTGQSAREAATQPKTVNPNAKTSPGSAQAGGSGSQINQNVAPQQTPGVIPGYELDEQGIPRKVQQPPQQ